jgi:hypothetical protein
MVHPPQLRLQVSECSTFLVMCDVPRTAVICRESTDWLWLSLSLLLLLLLLSSPSTNNILRLIKISFVYLTQELRQSYFSGWSKKPAATVACNSIGKWSITFDHLLKEHIPVECRALMVCGNTQNQESVSRLHIWIPNHLSAPRTYQFEP